MKKEFKYLRIDVEKRKCTTALKDDRGKTLDEFLKKILLKLSTKHNIK
jgi:hypothetical protein